MSSTVSTRDCPVCLEKFRNPVVTPCGHLTCEPCINVHIRLSSDHGEATCPTCRARFPTALANLSTIPNKYHVFISPPLRRVYLGDGEDDDLKLEISNLKARVVALTRDNKCLSKDLLAAQSDVTRLTSSERAARLALEEVKEGARVTLDKEKEEMRLANRRLDELTALCGALSLKSQGMDSPHVLNTRRTSGHAVLDNPPSTNIQSSSQDTKLFKGRPIRALPQRVTTDTPVIASCASPNAPTQTPLSFSLSLTDVRPFTFTVRPACHSP